MLCQAVLSQRKEPHLHAVFTQNHGSFALAQNFGYYIQQVHICRLGKGPSSSLYLTYGPDGPGLGIRLGQKNELHIQIFSISGKDIIRLWTKGCCHVSENMEKLRWKLNIYKYSLFEKYGSQRYARVATQRLWPNKNGSDMVGVQLSFKCLPTVCSALDSIPSVGGKRTRNKGKPKQERLRILAPVRFQ